MLDPVVGAAGDLKASSASVRLRSARQIDRLVPQVMNELLAANDTSDHGT
jgi:hypothetical protein